MNRKPKPPLPRLTDVRDTKTLDAYLRLALLEDGAWDDATSLSVIPAGKQAKARIFAKARGVYCGGIVAERVFKLLDGNIVVKRLAREGREVNPGDKVVSLTGPLRSLLSAERVALNFIQRLSGIATLSSKFTRHIGVNKVILLDTRKTTPLWRALERHAVRTGGGRNHRFALDDMVMIKDNHADAIGGVRSAIERARSKRPDLPIAAEARTVAQARAAAEVGADIVMLDNMTPAQIRRSVEAVAGRAQTEATGGANVRNIAALARTGVDRISVGALTHSAPALDFSMLLL